MLDTMIVDTAGGEPTKWPPYVQEFRQVLTGAIEGIVKAAKVYVHAINEDPERAKEFRSACPRIPEGTWSYFDKIGRDQLDARLVVEKVSHKSRIERLPFPDQKRLLDGVPVELLVNGGEVQDVLKVDVRTITSDQAAQLFAGDHLRDMAEQKAWLVDQERKAKLLKGEPEAMLPYHIRGDGKITFTKGATFTKAELRNILRSM